MSTQPATTEPLLSVRGLSASTEGGIEILHEVDLEVAPGERVGLIGQSGSGKTTLVRAVVGIEDPAIGLGTGTITAEGRTVLGPGVDERAGLRGRTVGTIFQSAARSVNPYRRIGSQLREVGRFHRPSESRAEVDDRIAALLSRMGLRDTTRILKSHPHQVSGGQLQRVAIALALLADPRLVIADECTSALDVSTQAEVVSLLDSVTGLDNGLIFVTHDLRLASRICDRVVVLRGGRVVDSGPAAALLAGDCSDYTRSLLAALPPWAPADGSWPPPVEALLEPASR